MIPRTVWGIVKEFDLLVSEMKVIHLTNIGICIILKT